MRRDGFEIEIHYVSVRRRILFFSALFIILIINIIIVNKSIVNSYQTNTNEPAIGFSIDDIITDDNSQEVKGAEESPDLSKNVIAYVEPADKDYSMYPTYTQLPDYPNGCEAASLYLLLKYYNVDVSIDTLMNNLKKQPITITKSNGTTCATNPNEYFLGDPRYSKDSHGVYNDPIKELADNYKSDAISRTGMPFEEVESLVKSGRPVIAWATINMKLSSRILLGNDCNTGQKLYWLSNEHAVLLIDVTDDKVVLSDPLTGSIRTFNKDTFINRYNTMGQRVVYY